jgi:hypothetical protein
MKVGSISRAINLETTVDLVCGNLIVDAAEHGRDRPVFARWQWLEVAKRLRAEFREDVQLISYSAYDTSVRDQVRQAGFDHHFVKGRDPCELARWLEPRGGADG